MIRRLYIHTTTRQVVSADRIRKAQKMLGVSNRSGRYFVSLYDPFQDKDAVIPTEIQPLADELKQHMLMENVF